MPKRRNGAAAKLRKQWRGLTADEREALPFSAYQTAEAAKRKAAKANEVSGKSRLFREKKTAKPASEPTRKSARISKKATKALNSGAKRKKIPISKPLGTGTCAKPDENVERTQIGGAVLSATLPLIVPLTPPLPIATSPQLQIQSNINTVMPGPTVALSSSSSLSSFSSSTSSLLASSSSSSSLSSSSFPFLDSSLSSTSSLDSVVSSASTSSPEVPAASMVTPILLPLTSTTSMVTPILLPLTSTTLASPASLTTSFLHEYKGERRPRQWHLQKPEWDEHCAKKHVFVLSKPLEDKECFSGLDLAVHTEVAVDPAVHDVDAIYVSLIVNKMLERVCPATRNLEQVSFTGDLVVLDRS